MGYAYGLISAFCFGAGAVLFRLGQRNLPGDDGHWLSNLVNAVVFGGLALVVAWPTWDLNGFVTLVVAGIAGTVLGRFSLLRGIRLIGATRGNTFQAATPVTAAVVGWIVLGETVSALEAAGGALTIYGLVRIVRSRGDDSTETPDLTGYLVACGAPLFFGVAFVLRRWGLEQFPGSVTGAFIGSTAGIVVLSLWEAGQGRLRRRIRDGRSAQAWPFIAAGLITTGALLTQFLALERIEAWIVGILIGTSAIWTAALSMIFLRGDERLTLSLMASIGVVFVGISVIAVG
ncbi:MAG: DMT family transporter [Acidimicrobiia bacterium]|nr:DMT family transporter [Acidimicrobiia bacterium]